MILPDASRWGPWFLNELSVLTRFAELKMCQCRDRERTKVSVPVEVLPFNFDIVHAISLALPLTPSRLFLACSHGGPEISVDMRLSHISKIISYQGFDSGG